MEIKSVEEDGKYYRVKFNDSDRFEKFSTPKWAEDAASEICENSRIRLGRLKERRLWQVETVLIEKSNGREKAEEKAQQIAEMI